MALEFNDPKQLEEFLADKPVEWSRLIAARSALRVLPFMLNLNLPMDMWKAGLRACFISWAAAKNPARDMKSAASSADSALFATLFAADSAARSAADSALSALSSTLSAARSAGSAGSAARSAALSTDDSTNSETFSTSSVDLVWRSIEVDLLWLEVTEGTPDRVATLTQPPLWPMPAPGMAMRNWARFASASKVADEGYGPWIGWYNTLLTADGTAYTDYFGKELTIRIATQPDEWWDRPAREVNADIARWLAERDAEKIVIPDPEPGTTLGIAEDGRIGIVPSGLPSAEEQIANEVLLEVLVEQVEELADRLDRSNAFADLLKSVHKYAEALRQRPFSIDRIYARGNGLENTRAHLQKEIDADNLPDMALGVAAGLDSVLAIHGPLIASTRRGQELLECSHQYEGKSADIAAQRLTARKFANAVARSDTTFTDEVREEWPVMADNIGSGPYPERSTQVAMSANRNLLITVAKVALLEVLKAGLLASAPGIALTGVTTAAANAVWAFLTSHLPVIRDFVHASGSYFQWIEPLLRRVERRLRS